MGTLRAQSRELTISLIIFIFAHKQPQLFVDIMPATPPYEDLIHNYRRNCRRRQLEIDNEHRQSSKPT